MLMMVRQSLSERTYDGGDVRYHLIRWNLAILFEELARAVAKLGKVFAIPVAFVIDATVAVPILCRVHRSVLEAVDCRSVWVKHERCQGANKDIDIAILDERMYGTRPMYAAIACIDSDAGKPSSFESLSTPLPP